MNPVLVHEHHTMLGYASKGIHQEFLEKLTAFLERDGVKSQNLQEGIVLNLPAFLKEHGGKLSTSLRSYLEACIEAGYTRIQKRGDISGPMIDFSPVGKSVPLPSWMKK